MKYICAQCNGSFETEDGWDPKAEARELYGEDYFEKDMNPCLVCDDCFKEIQESVGGKEALSAITRNIFK